MKKAVLICLLILGCCGTGLDRSFAQSKYQGEVELGASVGSNDYNCLGLNVINGVRFNKYLYAGVGIGASTSLSDELYEMPFFADIKAFYPVTNKLKLFVVTDLGLKTDFDYAGFFVNPGFGLNVELGKRLALNVSLRYEYYSVGNSVSIMVGSESLNMSYRVNMNSFGLKVGLCF